MSLVVAGLILIGPSFLGAQDKIRTVLKPTTSANDPIRLVDEQVGNQRFDNDNKVIANRDWLKNLSLRVKNTSNKEILHIGIYAMIAKQGTMPYPRRLTLRYGMLPMPSLFGKPNGFQQAKVLKPNEVAEVQVYNAEDVVRALLDHKADPEAIELIYDMVVFEDGTAWSQGQWLRANPTENSWDYLDRNGDVIKPSVVSKPRMVSDKSSKSCGSSPLFLTMINNELRGNLFSSVLSGFFCVQCSNNSANDRGSALQMEIPAKPRGMWPL